MENVTVTQIIELIVVCGAIFIPIGFVVRDNFYRFKIFYRIAPDIRSNLRREGLFKDYIDVEETKK